MTNSDTTFGTYNKLTKEMRAYWHEDPANATVRNEEAETKIVQLSIKSLVEMLRWQKAIFLLMPH